MSKEYTLRTAVSTISAIHFPWNIATGLLAIATVVCYATIPVLGDITIDPDSLGYTDIIPGDPASWTSSTIPSVGFTLVGEVRVDGGSDVVSERAFLGDLTPSVGYFTVDGVGSTWENRFLHVGDSGDGTLNIVNGGLVSGSGSSKIGYGSDSIGIVTVDGTGSTWNNGGGVVVGRSGYGTLDIINGGQINCGISNIGSNVGLYSGSTGVVTIDGTDSIWTNSDQLFLGREGTGTMNIMNGGQVSNNSEGNLGYSSGSIGNVIVDGIGSIWTNSGSMHVGRSGEGMLDITEGGQVSNTQGYVGGGSDSKGVVTVAGVGSTWNNSDWLFVGIDGIGTLNIMGGGQVSNTRGFVGHSNPSSGSSGSVLVTGEGSIWTNTVDMAIGSNGNSTVDIFDGGRVSIAGALTIYDKGNGENFVNMATGGMLAIYGSAADSLTSFMELINGTDAVRYWDDSITDWADITGATYGQDYTLSYLTEGDLAGYTMLTVTAIPEPVTFGLMALSGFLVMRRKHSAAKGSKTKLKMGLRVN